MKGLDAYANVRVASSFVRSHNTGLNPIQEEGNVVATRSVEVGRSLRRGFLNRGAPQSPYTRKQQALVLRSNLRRLAALDSVL